MAGTVIRAAYNCTTPLTADKRQDAEDDLLPPYTPTVCLDVTFVVVYSYGYNSGKIVQLAAQ